jgi:glutathione S-transferase
MCIIEKGIESRVQCVRSVTAIATPNIELQRFNPLSKIPTLITAEGLALFDSDVICEYLDTEYPPATLYPARGPTRWLTLRWCALGSGILDALVLWRTERNRPPAQQMPTILGALDVKVNAALDLIEYELPAIQASGVDISHVAIACALGYLDFRFSDINWRSSRPRARAWLEEFSQRPAFRRTLPYEVSSPSEAEPHFWKQAVFPEAPSS